MAHNRSVEQSTQRHKHFRQSTINILEGLTFTHPFAMGACAIGGKLGSTDVIESLPIVVMAYSGLSIIKDLLYLTVPERKGKLKNVANIALNAFAISASAVATQTPFAQTGNTADLTAFFLQMAIIDVGKAIANLTNALFLKNSEPEAAMLDIQDIYGIFLQKTIACCFRSIGWLTLALGHYSGGWILQAAAAIVQIITVNAPVASFAWKKFKFTKEVAAEVEAKAKPDVMLTPSSPRLP